MHKIVFNFSSTRFCSLGHHWETARARQASTRRSTYRIRSYEVSEILFILILLLNIHITSYHYYILLLLDAIIIRCYD